MRKIQEDEEEEPEPTPKVRKARNLRKIQEDEEEPEPTPKVKKTKAPAKAPKAPAKAPKAPAKAPAKKPEKECPPGKVYNPLTNRCVKADGKIGKEIKSRKN